MSTAVQEIPDRGTFPHGVHPPERKTFSEKAAIEVVPSPAKVVLPLQQHLGAPCEAVVKARQKVSFGEMVAKSQGFISTNLHAPITGTVKKLEMTTLANGRHLQGIPIVAEGDQLEGQALWDEIYGGEWPKQISDDISPEKISEMVLQAGIVGLGGAAFPSHVKIMTNEKKPVDTLLVNGCECEPYLTCDYRLMLEAADAIIAGTLLAARGVGAENIVICLEDNKPDAISMMRDKAAGTGIKIAVLKTKYPQGSEKQLIYAVVKRKTPLGGLPGDIGVLVHNVATVTSVARAVLRGKPLTHRVVCVTGPGVAQPKNLLAPIGIDSGSLIDFCGGLTADASRLVSGGPMMGFAFSDLKTPVTKGTSAITVLTEAHVRKARETNCVRCGRCVDVCPMNLVPSRLAMASRYGDTEVAQRYHIMACFECGCCAYTCPAEIPLVQLIRTGKAQVVKESKK